MRLPAELALGPARDESRTLLGRLGRYNRRLLPIPIRGLLLRIRCVLARSAHWLRNTFSLLRNPLGFKNGLDTLGGGSTLTRHRRLPPYPLAYARLADARGAIPLLEPSLELVARQWHTHGWSLLRV